MERLLLRAAHKIAHPLMLQMKKRDQSEGPRDAAEILNEAFQLEEED
mgnify:CR=1 FL=1